MLYYCFWRDIHGTLDAVVLWSHALIWWWHEVGSECQRGSSEVSCLSSTSAGSGWVQCVQFGEKFTLQLGPNIYSIGKSLHVMLTWRDIRLFIKSSKCKSSSVFIVIRRWNNLQQWGITCVSHEVTSLNENTGGNRESNVGTHIDGIWSLYESNHY